MKKTIYFVLLFGAMVCAQDKPLTPSQNENINAAQIDFLTGQATLNGVCATANAQVQNARATFLSLQVEYCGKGDLANVIDPKTRQPIPSKWECKPKPEVPKK